MTIINKDSATDFETNKVAMTIRPVIDAAGHSPEVAMTYPGLQKPGSSDTEYYLDLKRAVKTYNDTRKPAEKEITEEVFYHILCNVLCMTNPRENIDALFSNEVNQKLFEELFESGVDLETAIEGAKAPAAPAAPAVEEAPAPAVAVAPVNNNNQDSINLNLLIELIGSGINAEDAKEIATVPANLAVLEEGVVPANSINLDLLIELVNSNVNATDAIEIATIPAAPVVEEVVPAAPVEVMVFNQDTFNDLVGAGMDRDMAYILSVGFSAEEANAEVNVQGDYYAPAIEAY